MRIGAGLCVLVALLASGLDERGARMLIDRERVAGEIARMRGAGDVEMTTDEILALTRR